jgi:DNA mismatch repair protein MutS2
MGKARKRTEALNRDLEERLEAIEDERREVIAKARAEAELEVAVLKKNIETLKKQLKQARQPLEAIKRVEDQIEEIEEKVEEPVERKRVPAPETRSMDQAPLKLGERVTVGTLNADGVVTSLGESDAEVQVGTLRIRAKLSDLERKGGPAPEASDQPETTYTPSAAIGSPAPGMELDLRGQASDEALETLERYLDRAFSAGYPFVRIIHGKGTGKLRQVVRSALRRQSHVTSFEEGGPTEGGEGVTVVKLK